MKKTKTNKKIFTIFSAILGVVFAFLTGFTYCATTLDLEFGQAPNSTAAYLANQQYRIINDTTNTPVLFGEGAHNFEVALQYSFDYSFDVRLEYSLSWSGNDSKSTDNVILHFADRDNIIYDEKYIFLADSIPAGNGKVNVIAGVDFVDPTNKEYFGRRLTISIDDVKIYKEQDSYPNTTQMISDLVTLDGNKNITKYDSVAAETWLQYKKNATAAEDATTFAYAMVYNYRRNYVHGVPYPGLNSAYKKPVAMQNYKDETLKKDYVQNYVYGSNWAGGNRAYAGTGMYVIAGSTPLELEIQVEGIWRQSSSNDSQIYENNIQYSYTQKWDFKEYDADRLWETRTFTHYIPKNTACYIEINDGVEVTSAGSSTILAYDAYRLVTNAILINPSLGEVNQTAFTYDETKDSYIQFKKINNYVDVAETTAYVEDVVSVVNTTTYANGLYDTLAGGTQTYSTNLTLINNTAQTQQVPVDLDLWYHISNGEADLYKTTDQKRASQLILDKTLTFKDLFDTTKNRDLYYSYSESTIANLESTKKFTIKIGPYASLNLTTSYSVGGGLATYVRDIFDDPSTTSSSLTSKFTEYYDVWTYLVPTVGECSAVETSVLTLETTQTNNATIVSVKNNTNSVVEGISLTNFSIKALGNAVFEKEEGDPYDWDASYWKYYSENNDNAQLTTKPTYVANTYWKRTQTYSSLKVSEGDPEQSISSNFLNSAKFKRNGEGDSATIDETTIVYSKTLLPGESVQILTFSTTAQVIVTGDVTPTIMSAPNSVEIINNGTSDAYVINYSSSSYYLRLSGTITGSKFAQFDDDANYSYYVGIVRPGQIVKVAMSESATIDDGDKVAVDATYENGDLPASWSAKAKVALTNYFNMNKSNSTT